MGFLQDIFSAPPYPSHAKVEVNRLIEELVSIGKKEDFLSEHPGGSFNRKCRHIRTREIGTRLDEMGGYELMEYVTRKVKNKTSKTLAEHLEYAWAEIGHWMP